MTSGTASMGLCQNGAAPDGHDALARKIFGDGILYHQFRTAHFHGRQKLAVRQLRKPLGLAADADEILDIVVPRRNILIANGPVNAHVLPQVRFEVQITPAIGLPAPYDRPTANLSSADPQEWSVGIHRVRIFFIIDEKFAVPLVHSGARLLDRLIDAYLLALAHAAKT